MAYCTQTDIIKELPEAKLKELTDDENLGAVNAARVTEAIAKADSIIDAYCGGRYQIPFTSVPQVIKTLSVSLSIYNLYKRRGRMSNTLQDQYTKDVKLLEAISKGVVTLGVQPPPTDSPADYADYEAVDDTDRTFTKTTLTNF